MNSIITNFAAMTALQSLNTTNRKMLEAQSRVSTGFRVGQASDNAAYWSMATTMRSDNKSLSAVADALGLGASTIDVAYVAMDTAIDVVTEIQKRLVLARQPGADRIKIQTEIDQLQEQLRSNASSAAFAGENWLFVDNGQAVGGTYAYTATEQVVASFSRSGDTVSVGTISIDISTTYLFNLNTDGVGGPIGSGAATNDQLGILGSTRLAATGEIDPAGTIVLVSADGTAEMDVSAATETQIDEFITAVDRALAEITDAATNLGAAKNRINLQKEFVANLTDSIDRGISTLVDADMNEESTRIQALQVQQQLGIQALSLANQNSQNILALFQG